jgi:IS30 family transposase
MKFLQAVAESLSEIVLHEVAKSNFSPSPTSSRIGNDRSNTSPSEIRRRLNKKSGRICVGVANKDTESVVSALIKQSQRLPSELYRSLTWDRGKELADHQRLTLATEVEVYFCDPRSPWQRGSNENTNRLLRQYLPRGTDLSLHSQAKLSAIARQLNERPRKTLLYQTPADKFAECVAATS